MAPLVSAAVQENGVDQKTNMMLTLDSTLHAGVKAAAPPTTGLPGNATEFQSLIAQLLLRCHTVDSTIDLMNQRLLPYLRLAGGLVTDKVTSELFLPTKFVKCERLSSLDSDDDGFHWDIEGEGASVRLLSQMFGPNEHFLQYSYIAHSRTTALSCYLNLTSTRIHTPDPSLVHCAQPTQHPFVRLLAMLVRLQWICTPWGTSFVEQAMDIYQRNGRASSGEEKKSRAPPVQYGSHSDSEEAWRKMINSQLIQSESFILYRPC